MIDERLLRGDSAGRVAERDLEMGDTGFAPSETPGVASTVLRRRLGKGMLWASGDEVGYAEYSEDEGL